MQRLVVAEDSKIDRVLVEGLLANEADLTVDCFPDGAEALASIESEPPDLVLTDLIMPNLDGLQLTAAVTSRFASVPVILMTSQGSEEVAMQALRAGAASYIPKSALATDLRETVRKLLSVVREERDVARLMERMVSHDTSFELPNDVSVLGMLVKHLQECTARMEICDEIAGNQLGVALYEALINAAHHGNLEVKSDLRETDMDAHQELLRQRREAAPYKDRRVHVNARFTRDEAQFVIRDEGPGFDPSSLPDPRDPENLLKVSGRGVLLMRSFMSEVNYNETGNEVEMVLRRPEG